MKVVDYKTGSKAFDVVSLYHGLQLQLMVYMDAAVSLENSFILTVRWFRQECSIIGSTIRWWIRRRKGEEEAILKELKPDGLINLKDDVLLHMDRCQSGSLLRFRSNIIRTVALPRTRRQYQRRSFS